MVRGRPEHSESEHEDSQDVTVVAGPSDSHGLKRKANPKAKCTARAQQIQREKEQLAMRESRKTANNMSGESQYVQVGNPVAMERPLMNTSGSVRNPVSMKRPSMNTTGSKRRMCNVTPDDGSTALTQEKRDVIDVEKPTRGMRHAFKMYFKTLDIQVQNTYNEIQSSNMLGKRAMMDDIIMKSIPKGRCYNMKPTANLLSTVQATSNLNYMDNQAFGVTYTEMKAKLGGDAAIQEGLARKDIFIGPDNMYYLKRVRRGETHTFEQSSQIDIQGRMESDKDTELAKFEMLANVGDWVSHDFHQLGSCSSGSADVPSETKLMENVQEAFDAATQLTLSVKKSLQNLSKSTGSSTSHVLVQRGIELCKALVPSSEEIEQYLLSPVNLLDRSKVVSTLMDAAKHLQALDIFRAEVEATLGAQVKRTK